MGKYIVRFFMRLAAMLPLKLHYANASFLAWFIRCVARYRVTDVTINLSRAFPDKKYWEIKPIVKDFYRHFAELIVEAVWFGGCTNAKRLKKADIVSIPNPEVLADAYENSPSVMVLFSHAGNWELLSGMESYNNSERDTHMREENVCIVYRQLTSKLWDDIMRANRLAPLRDKKNAGYVESASIMRYVVSHRNEKRFYYLNTDQRPYFDVKEPPMVTFMHQECKCMTGGAALAHKLGLAVVYMNVNRTRRGHYDLEYALICQDARSMSVEEINRKFYDLLEKDLERNPSNYLWTHRRWQ